MLRLKYILSIVIALFFFNSTLANDSQAEFKKYLNDIAQEIKKTDDSVEKRKMLDNLFHKLLEASEYIENWPLFSDEEKAGISEFKKKVELKHDELNGYNDFNKVADADLNRFADYTVQEFEQAVQYVTISVLTLVLIILLVAILL